MKPKHYLALGLGLALSVTGLLAVNYGVKAQRSAQALEDTYAYHLSETQEYLQSIVLKLAKTPLASDTDMQVDLLSGISRQADGVVGGLSALPLSHAAMSDTVAFCNQLSEYALRLALSAAAGETLGTDSVERLNQLETQCTQLLGQFAAARDTMLRQSLQLSNQADAFYQEASPDARPLEQLADSDNGMDYPSMIYDGAFSDARHNGQPKALGTALIDQRQAVDIACDGVALTLTDGLVLNAEVTQTGGHLLWIMPENAAFESRLTLEKCIQKGQTFLKQNGYGDTEANHYQVYDGLAVINFVALQDGVLLYPDLVKVQMRMDTGELVGLESNNYLMNHIRRNLEQPVLTRQQALERGGQRLQNATARLCLIPYRDSERLCYEIAGSYQEHEYRLYLDAVTGAQLEILMMVDAPEGQLAA